MQCSRSISNGVNLEGKACFLHNIRMSSGKKVALITGITGQDGSYLAEFLLEKGYDVHGLVRRSSLINIGRIEHLYTNTPHPTGRIFLHYGDLADTASLISLLVKVKPDEIYHLGAMSDVRISFEIPEYTANITALGTLRMLEAMRHSGLAHAKFYQASSSEMFGSTPDFPQKETSPFHPQSPYGIAKVFADQICKNYRKSYGMFICSGILFNHESPRRGENFVTRKITIGIANILAGKQKKIYLGNLDAKRDWGYAPEYAEAMWRMLQHEKPDDYVVATGESHSVQEFLEEAFRLSGLKWQDHVGIKPELFRPSEIAILQGDNTKARAQLGWEPKVKFKDLVRILLEEDCKKVGVKFPTQLV